MKYLVTCFLFYSGGLLHANGLAWGGIFFVILGFLTLKMEFKKTIKELK